MRFAAEAGRFTASLRYAGYASELWPMRARFRVLKRRVGNKILQADWFAGVLIIALERFV